MNTADSPPRVSLVILAYNQEAFVAEALAAAFAQDYPNLEIVFSDDGSKDRTHNIARELVEAYQGPHRVLLNRREQSRGILDHVYDAVGRTSAEFIVMAAADDVSYPNRVSSLVKTWQNTGADVVFSGFDRIDEDGRPLGQHVEYSDSEYSPAAYFPRGKAVHLMGCSTAYSREVFRAVSLPQERVDAEDYFFSLVLGWRSRKIEFIPEALLAYRAHGQSLTHTGDNNIRDVERRAAWTAASFAALLRLFDKMASSGSGVAPGWGEPAQVRFRRLRADADYLELRAKWMDLPLHQRLAGLARFRRPHQLRWMAPRLFGLGALTALKRLVGRSAQPSSNSE